MRRHAPSRKGFRRWMLAASVASVAAAAVVSMLILLSDPASAQSMGRGGASVRANVGGYCPLGTCNIHGGRMARFLNNCKASNCRS